MPAPFHFEQSIAFDPARAPEILRQLPAQPGVLALYGPASESAATPAPQPYLTRAADLRRRITRILAPPDPTSKRLNLSARVARIDYTVTGSEFESTLVLYHASAAIFGLDEARRRLKLRTPYFLRFTAENSHPRVYSTNRIGRRSLADTYGPFPSRAAADRYADAVLDLFKLRRCYEDLIPSPDHPGCIYGEMKKCLAPCNQAHTPQGAAAYSAEAAAVKRFFDTHGESSIIALGLDREEASAAMEFERAAELHAQWHKVKAVQALAAELVQPIPNLRALIVQRSAGISIPAASRTSSGNRDPEHGEEPASSAVDRTETTSRNCHPEQSEGPASSAVNRTEASPSSAVFLLHAGCLTGPEPLSTLGVRAVKEQTSVGSSLFAQPLMLQAIPLEEPASHCHPERSDEPASHCHPERSEGPASHCHPERSERPASHCHPERSEGPASHCHPERSEGPASSSHPERSEGPASPSTNAPSLSPELRTTQLIALLEQQASLPADLALLSDHLSLLRRWYYRPEKQRAGEIFFPDANSAAADGRPAWPIRRILRGAARMALGDPAPMAETQRDLATRNPEDAAQKPTRTKILHEGRPDVERIVHIIDPPPAPRTFTSRRKSRP